ncbi:MAG: TrgA family protein [Rhodobacteraceae bacterium]|nr:TrgA family protein [Paracoccaceae bacterium]
MPTAAKLVAALVFAAVAFLGASVYVPLLPEGTQARWFAAASAAIGALVGWLVMGPLAGRGLVAAMGYGLRTAATIVFWTGLLFSGREMILRSLNMRYDGPMEAVVGVFDIALDYGRLLADPQILAVLGLGGMVGGIAAELASRRWK